MWSVKQSSALSHPDSVSVSQCLARTLLLVAAAPTTTSSWWKRECSAASSARICWLRSCEPRPALRGVYSVAVVQLQPRALVSPSWGCLYLGIGCGGLLLRPPILDGPREVRARLCIAMSASVAALRVRIERSRLGGSVRWGEQSVSQIAYRFALPLARLHARLDGLAPLAPASNRMRPRSSLAAWLTPAVRHYSSPYHSATVHVPS